MTDNDPFAPPTFQGPSFEPERSPDGLSAPSGAAGSPPASVPPFPPNSAQPDAFEPTSAPPSPFAASSSPSSSYPSSPSPSSSSPSRGAKIGAGVVIVGLAAAAGLGWWQASANASDADEVSAELAGVSAEVDALRTEVAAKDEALDAIATELATVQEDLAGATGDRDGLATEVAALAADNATLAADLERVTTNLETAESELAATEALLADATEVTEATTPSTTAPPVSDVPPSAIDGVLDESELSIIQEALPGLIAEGFTLTPEEALAIATQTCAVPDLAALDVSANAVAEQFGLSLFEGGILSGLTAGFVCYDHLEAIGVPLS